MTTPNQALSVREDTVKSLLASDSYKKRFSEVLGRRAPQFMASISNALRDRQRTEIANVGERMTKAEENALAVGPQVPRWK